MASVGVRPEAIHSGGAAQKSAASPSSPCGPCSKTLVTRLLSWHVASLSAMASHSPPL